MSRPAIVVEIVRTRHEAWKWFASHHYLSQELNKTARCFLGLVEGRPAAFGAILPFPHPKLKRICRLTRTVVLPDFQGVGISSGFCAFLGALCASNGYGLLATTSHPALIAARQRSVYWEQTRPAKVRKTTVWPTTASPRDPERRAQVTASFRYTGGPLPAAAMAHARLMWHGH